MGFWDKAGLDKAINLFLILGTDHYVARTCGHQSGPRAQGVPKSPAVTSSC